MLDATVAGPVAAEVLVVRTATGESERGEQDGRSDAERLWHDEDPPEAAAGPDRLDASTEVIGTPPHRSEPDRPRPPGQVLRPAMMPQVASAPSVLVHLPYAV